MLRISFEFAKPRWGALQGMTCKETIHLICWYLEGKLSSDVEIEVERHLRTCPDCYIVLDAAISTLERHFGASHPIDLKAPTNAA